MSDPMSPEAFAALGDPLRLGQSVVEANMIAAYTTLYADREALREQLAPAQKVLSLVEWEKFEQALLSAEKERDTLRERVAELEAERDVWKLSSIANAREITAYRNDRDLDRLALAEMHAAIVARVQAFESAGKYHDGTHKGTRELIAALRVIAAQPLDEATTQAGDLLQGLCEVGPLIWAAYERFRATMEAKP